MLRTALGVLLVAPVAFARPQAEAQVYDVGALRRAVLYEPQLEREGFQLETAWLDDLEPDPLEVEPDVALEALLRELEQLPEVSTLRAFGDRLFVRATPAGQAAVARRLAELERELLRPVVVEAWQLAAHSLPADVGARLAPAEVDALLAAARPLRRVVTTTLPGRRARMTAQRVQSLLIDVDVEGLQPNGIADPQVTALLTGAELGARAVPGADGAWLVELWGRSGTPRAAREWVLAPFAPMVLTLPEVATTQWRATATLADGGGVLLGLADGDGGPWLVRVHGDARGSSSCVPVGAGLLPRSWSRPCPFSPVQVSGGWLVMDGPLAEHSDEPTWRRETLARAWRDQPWLEGWSAPDDPAAPSWAWPAPEEPARAEVLRARLARLELRFAPSYALELRFGLVDEESLRELDAAALASRLEHRLYGTARGGDSFWTFGGGHRLYVKDHDVEIGSSAMGPDPCSDVVVDGVSFWCQPTPLADGRALVASELCWQRELSLQPGQGAGRVREVLLSPRLRELGTVELPAAARADVSDFAAFEDGAWQVVARTSVTGVEGTLVGALRVTR